VVVLSCGCRMVVGCLVLSSLVKSSLGLWLFCGGFVFVLACLGPVCLVAVLSCRVLSYLVFSCFVLWVSCHDLSRLVLSVVVLFCLVLSSSGLVLACLCGIFFSPWLVLSWSGSVLWMPCLAVVLSCLGVVLWGVFFCVVWS
jgi:hypothetical protein